MPPHPARGVAGASGIIPAIVEAALGPLLPLFERERAAGRAVVLGVLLETHGSTYRKPGALILIAAGGEYAGLISGGCLEGDLAEHARRVLASGRPERIGYDMRRPDDLLWGLGLGCEGAMQILLLRVGPAESWQPLEYLIQAHAAERHATLGVIARSVRPELPVGTLVYPRDPHAPEVLRRTLASAAAEDASAAVHEAGTGLELFVLTLVLPPRVLLLGAGPDAAPVVEFAARLGWRMSVVDHRAAYARAAHFPLAHQVLLSTPDALPQTLALDGFRAAVVMSHQLPADLAWLRLLATSRIPYVGLLGPAMRRERLLDELGPAAARLQDRLHAPVGLPLGGRSPESIALAIVAEIHAFVHGTSPPRALRPGAAGREAVAGA